MHHATVAPLSVHVKQRAMYTEISPVFLLESLWYNCLPIQLQVVLQNDDVVNLKES